MKHKGEILKKAIEASGIKMIRVIELTGIPKPTLYKIFGQSNPKLDYVFKIGKAIKYDFSENFPELTNKSAAEAEENLNFQIKYMELAEKLITVMEERETYRKKLEEVIKKNK